MIRQRTARLQVQREAWGAPPPIPKFKLIAGPELRAQAHKILLSQQKKDLKTDLSPEEISVYWANNMTEPEIQKHARRLRLAVKNATGVVKPC